MDRLRSLGCVVNGEWVGSPRRLAYAHVASDKSKIGEAERGGSDTPRLFIPSGRIYRRGEAASLGEAYRGSPAVVDLTLKTTSGCVFLISFKIYIYFCGAGDSEIF